MSLKLRTRMAKDVAIIDASGRFTLGEDTDEFRDRVEAVVDTGFRKLLINLAAVSYLDISALGELIAAYTLVRRQGGEVKLLNLTQRALDLLTVTKLVTVFELFEDENTGLRSFSQFADGALVERTGPRLVHATGTPA